MKMWNKARDTKQVFTSKPLGKERKITGGLVSCQFTEFLEFAREYKVVVLASARE